MDQFAAAAAYKDDKPSATWQEVSNAFDIPKTTLFGRLTGRHTSHEGAAKKRLSEAQEQVLVSKINQYASFNILLTPREVRGIAELLAGEKLGVNWVSTFIRRKQGELTSRYHGYKDRLRVKANTPDTRRAFHALVKDAYASHSIKPCNIYNMDEAGFQLAFSRKTIKVAPKSYTKSQQARAESSEHVTVVAAIGVTDAPVPPLIIYRGQQLQESWFNNNEDVSMRAIVTDSGWSNDYIALKWLIEVFEPATKDRAQN
ncbi:protein of unknown function [Taphrina deformans PYCC 5710]|uniref:DDE-1 domain-containing protein n=1 Tax=Taphrina deformans (strain PYCC 5710 / ATCC 11124 / CBS 356.35 / IMI 108563 / JCM 9778 / NBRC 8474) TaxID=1097556 RepID=R4XP92_TAPDE|nr:protein of unknown function [Taphrina deformans PYCC 5710]|eukprot:CCG85065.1 protein of unknown function [Taphrina deformans PYCC 5710]